MGELLVDFVEYGWFPRVLPSEAAQGLNGSDSVDESDDDEDNS
jgi:methylated-DNA-protein-cysteine methyltransferase-like protein